MPRMMKVYPAGAIQGDGLMESLRNIDTGLDAMATLARNGFAVFPVFSDFLYLMRTDVAISGPGGIYEMSLTWMLDADALFMLPGWQMSKGACKEQHVAAQHGIPHFTEISALKAYRDDVWSKQ